MYTLSVDNRTRCDIELLATRAFHPLSGFMTMNEYHSVVHDWTLPNGDVFPLPIVLRITDDDYHRIQGDSSIVTIQLVYRDEPVAILHRTDLFEINVEKECQLVYGTTDTNHPYVHYLYQTGRRYAVGGPILEYIQPLVDRYGLCRTPTETRQYFQDHQWNEVVAFQTRNPMHRAHLELTKCALAPGMKLLIHPVMDGVTQEEDTIPEDRRVRCYRAILDEYDQSSVLLSGIPLSMRMAGPREAVFHAIIRANYGCTHFIVGRDHAGPSTRTVTGQPFYEPMAAHVAIQRWKDRLPIQVLCMDPMVYDSVQRTYVAAGLVSPDNSVCTLSGTQLRSMIRYRQPIPLWFTSPMVSRILTEPIGHCVYLVGLSCSGKTTVGRALTHHYRDTVCRPVTLLDGDDMRRLWQGRLGFTRQDRQCNTRMMGFIASEIVKHGGLCIVCNIAPYRSDRQHNRQLIKSYGHYLQVFVDTPLEVCRQRDTRGVYQQEHVTGVDDPFEIPDDSDLVLDGTQDVSLSVTTIVEYLAYVKSDIKDLKNI